MELTVSGLAGKTRFKHLWGRYIVGFKPRKHCIACFKCKVAKGISPEMEDGTYELKDNVGDFFYLCGVGQPESAGRGEEFNRKHTNVHLAVRARAGSVASVGSVYGATFTIKDAQAIPIRGLPRGFQGLSDTHSQCKNFQFGYEQYEVGSVSDYELLQVVSDKREGSIALNGSTFR